MLAAIFCIATGLPSLAFGFYLRSEGEKGPHLKGKKGRKNKGKPSGKKAKKPGGSFIIGGAILCLMGFALLAKSNMG